MSRKLELKERSTQSMLCPCCGESVLRASLQCGCGARFVGEPLDEAPIKVQRLGPAMSSVGLLALVVAASLITTKWMAVAALLVIWSSWRAMNLARRNSEWYGGYRTSVATLSVTIAGTLALATYGVAHIPKAIENYKIRQIAATQASMHHIASLLEEYKLNAGGGSYPKSEQDFKRVFGASLPTDYWDTSIRYEPRPGSYADSSMANFETSNFELRSSGSDGIAGTEDDIVMRGGVFFTNAEVKKQIVGQQLR